MFPASLCAFLVRAAGNSSRDVSIRPPILFERVSSPPLLLDVERARIVAMLAVVVWKQVLVLKS